MDVFYFRPVPKYTIWGGKTCNRYFHFTGLFSDGVGQALAFSAQEEDGTVCMSGEYSGMTLRKMWEEAPHLFGNPQGVFPLLISLVAPEDDLSVQVHPDAEYAAMHGYPMGKNEAWYFIGCAEGSSIVYGHRAADEAELRAMMGAGQWQTLLKRMPVKDKDFVYIPAGLLHALSKNTIVYEVQQSTDITYRLYDYDRRDENGNGRPLNAEEAIAAMKYGKAEEKPFLPIQINHENMAETTLIRNESFTVTRLEVTGAAYYSTANYRLATVAAGQGAVNGKPVIAGESFLIPVNTGVSLNGDMTVMLATRESASFLEKDGTGNELQNT